MRWCVLVAACSGSAVQPPTNVGVARPEKAVAVTDAPEDCASRMEDWKPGNHDRYAFEDPIRQAWGYRDGKGNVVIAPRFHHAYEFGPGGVAAVVDQVVLFAYIAPSGKLIAKAYAYDNGPDYFQEGFARIVDSNKKIGFMSDRGIIAIAPTFDEAEGFCRGKALVKLGAEQYWIDKQGRKTTPPPE
jgi:hypothetical protein